MKIDSSQHKALLCDASFSVIPILESLKKNGYTVFVCGNRASDPCHELADFSIKIDYSDKEALKNIVINEGIEYIVPGCTDVSYLTSSWIAGQLGMPGFDDYETTTLIHDKTEFRQFCEEKKYPIPEVQFTLDKAKKLKFPVLIKPSDSFSGKGIVKVYDVGELNNYWPGLNEYSENHRVVAEEFIDGDLYSHSAFIKNGKIIVDFFVSEYCTVYPYQVNSSNLASNLNVEIKSGMRDWLEILTADLNLCDGLVHTQFISNNREYFLVEVARRSPGDLYASLIQRSTQVNYASLYWRSFCGQDYPDIENTKSAYISRHTVSTTADCVYLSCNLALNNDKVFYVSLKNPGEILRKAPYDRAGIYFIEHSTEQQMEQLTPKLCDYVNIEKLTLE